MRTAAALAAAGCLAAMAALRAQDAGPERHAGRAAFERTCARCHGGDGNGGEMGPGIVARLALRTDDELAALVRSGLPERGMPPSAVADAELPLLIAFARSLRPDRETPRRLQVPLADGRVLSGVALNRTSTDLQLLGDDGLHLLRRAGDAWRTVTSQADWPTYHGDLRGNRYSALDEIDRGTVRRLAPAWVFGVPGAANLQVTPAVVGGVMYVAHVNECYALDAGTGRRIWHYRRPRRCRLGHQPWRRRRRRSRVHGDRPRAPDRAEPLLRRSRLGDDHGRLARELRRHVATTRRRRPGRLRHLGR
jgi:alcohol dehydrogenase (cytochrome c)